MRFPALTEPAKFTVAETARIPQSPLLPCRIAASCSALSPATAMGDLKSTAKYAAPVPIR